jgi:hypothetical protein
MADAHSSKIQGMRDTWAGGCDGFLAFSTESDPRLPAISLYHHGVSNLFVCFCVVIKQNSNQDLYNVPLNTIVARRIY